MLWSARRNSIRHPAPRERLKELGKAPIGGASGGPVCKRQAARDERAGLRGEYETALIPL
jgi:hypothetical protein